MQLVGAENVIVPAPGCDSNACMVKSTSGVRPHLVIPKHNGEYVCDSTCANWRSLGICSHSVAVAEKNDELQQFVTWFRQAKKRPNLTKLVLTGMPAVEGARVVLLHGKRRSRC